MSIRRSAALLIRLRQEALKRLDRVVPTSTPDGLRLDPPAIPLAPPSTRRPLPRLREVILAEAGAAARRQLSVFGSAARAFEERGSWRTHPVSGTDTASEHWSRLSYLRGEMGGDVKEIWELNRHRHLLRLAQAWHLTRDPTWTRALAEALDGWAEQNPPGFGINWASSLEVAFRAMTWTWIRSLTDRTDLWTPERTRVLGECVWHHARHVERYDSVHHSPNTHLTGEAVSLILMGLAWPDWPGSARRLRLGEQILTEELEYQVLDDGMHFERSPSYHRYTVEFYLLWVVFCRRGERPVPPEVMEALERMLEVTAALRRPDGQLPLIGDEDGGVTLPLSLAHSRDPGPLLAVGAALFGRSEWLWGLDPTHRDLAWWLLDDDMWATLEGLDPVEPEGGGASLESAGYFILDGGRGTRRWWALVDAGPHGAGLTGHAHLDLGHVELSLGATPVVVDPGSWAYTPDPARRDWDRGLAAHASVSVDGAPLALPSGSFGWASSAPDPVVSTDLSSRLPRCSLQYRWAADDGAVLSHRRVVLMGGSWVVVADWVHGASGREVTVSWPLGFSSERVLVHGQGHVELPGAGAGIRWFAEGIGEVSARVEGRSFAASYRVPTPGTLLKVGGSATRDASLFVTCFSSTRGDPPVEVMGGTVTIMTSEDGVVSIPS